MTVLLGPPPMNGFEEGLFPLPELSIVLVAGGTGGCCCCCGNPPEVG